MNKSIKLIFNYFLAPLLFAALCFSLYRQISSQSDLALRWNELKQNWYQPGFWFVFMLMFVNWGIESLKWKISLQPLEKINLRTAFRSVMSGCSITMLTPNRIGEYGGRILYLREENRLTAISITILGSISQLLITMLIGTIGLLSINASIHFQQRPELSWIVGKVLLFISISCILILLLIYFNARGVVALLQKISILKSFVKHMLVLRLYTRKLLLRILFLSFIRYMIFILQYIIMLNVMKTGIAFYDAFFLISIFYLVMAVAPTAGFIELPLRAIASVQVFGMASDNLLGIQAASLAIWLINLVIPAVIGSIMIFGIKILKER